jgi:hypothetical protein
MGSSHTRRLDIHYGYPASMLTLIPDILVLTFAYSKHLRATDRTHTLRGRALVLHHYRLWILDLPRDTALHTVCLHLLAPFLFKE